MSGDHWKCKMGLRTVSAAGITFGKDGREMLVCYCIVLPLEGTLEYMEYGSTVNFIPKNCGLHRVFVGVNYLLLFTLFASSAVNSIRNC